MNRRQRRSAWAKGIQRASAQAQGLMGLYVVRPVDVPELMLEALRNSWAASLTSLVNRSVLKVHSAPASNPIQCLCCRTPLGKRSRFSVVLVVPEAADPSEAITSVVCADCGTEPDVITAKAMTAFKAELWPDARMVTIGDQVGHA